MTAQKILLGAFSFLLEKAKNAAPDDFVITGVRGTMLSYGTLLRQTKRLCRESGIPEVSPHELRHSCSELWMRVGATSEDVSRLLNQSGGAVVRRYIHPTADRLHRLGEMIEIRPPEQHIH